MVRRTIKALCQFYIVLKNNFMRALVISGGGSKGIRWRCRTISLERKNEYDILLVLQLEVYLFRIRPK
jgi:hypothetical protein